MKILKCETNNLTLDSFNLGAVNKAMIVCQRGWTGVSIMYAFENVPYFKKCTVEICIDFMDRFNILTRIDKEGNVIKISDEKYRAAAKILKESYDKLILINEAELNLDFKEFIKKYLTQ